MMNYYLAIDIGASSGRHILAHMEDGKLVLEEIYRFNNQAIQRNGHLVWDVAYLLSSIKQGIVECVKQHKVPTTLGIDTWAVDYVLLDENKNLVMDSYSYRDKRCHVGVQEVQKLLSKKELYAQSGIQYQKFNTIYQLKSDEMHHKAAYFLMIPDYLHYRLCGTITHEYTNLSTTQLLTVEGKLDDQRCHRLHLSSTLFTPIVMPSTYIGNFLPEIADEVGCQCKIVVPATHDTGSAFMASVYEDAVIISSGTWSLLGIETIEPYVNELARNANFTNEGGYEHRYRFLKNIMGLWIIQEVSRELNGKYSFAQLVEEAAQHPFPLIFDVNDSRFLKPIHMIQEIQNYFIELNQQPPETAGEIAYCVYYSLAHCYHQAILELELITKKSYSYINIIGGGCQNELLNRMIAKLTNKTVVAGPVEATALGNLAAQLIEEGVFTSLQEARACIKASQPIKEYKEENNL